MAQVYRGRIEASPRVPNSRTIDIQVAALAPRGHAGGKAVQQAASRAARSMPAKLRAVLASFDAEALAAGVFVARGHVQH